MGVICDYQVKVQGFDITIPNAYHRIERVTGGKAGATAKVAVHELKGGPVKTTWSFGFTPDTSDRNWIAQAYDAMMLLRRMQGARSDDESDPYFAKPVRESFLERRARFRLENPDIVLPPVEGEEQVGASVIEGESVLVEPASSVEPEPEPAVIPEPDGSPEPAEDVESPPLARDDNHAVDVELSEIEDVEAARAIVLQRLMALSLAKAGLTMQTYLRMAELAAIQADPDATPEQKRDAELEAEQFKDRATAAQAYELARQLKAAKVATLTTIEQLRAYDIYEGWPP